MARSSNSMFGSRRRLFGHLAERVNRTSKALPNSLAFQGPPNTSHQTATSKAPTSVDTGSLSFSKALQYLRFGGTTPRTSIGTSHSKSHSLFLLPLLVLVPLFTSMMAMAVPSSAFAGVQAPAVIGGEGAQVWWGASIADRPTDLRKGVAVSEVQELVATPGAAFLYKGMWLVVSVAGKRVGEFATEELATLLSLPEPSAANIQGVLEDSYGAGDVKVTEKAGVLPGEVSLLVESVGADAGRAVAPLEVSDHATEDGGGAEARVLSVGKASGVIALSAINLGDGEAATVGEPVSIAARLPAGLRAVAIRGVEGRSETFAHGAVSCVLSSLSCTYEASEPGKGVPAFEGIEVFVSVVVEEAAVSGEMVSMSVSGGGAAGTKSATRKSTVDSPVGFGVEEYALVPEDRGGAVDTQAGSHPFQLTTYYTARTKESAADGEGRTVGLPRNIVAELPPGLVGNPTSFERCTDEEFAARVVVGNVGANQCPADSAVGVAVITYASPKSGFLETVSAPIFNMVPLPGEPARFGFKVQDVVPVFMSASLRTGSDYGLDVSLRNVVQSAWVFASKLTFFGVPGAKSHEHQLGWECLKEVGSCPAVTGSTAPPFLVMPTSCERPFVSTLKLESWPYEEHAGEHDEYRYELPYGVDGCGRLPFSPSLSVSPDVPSGSSASGVVADVHVPQTAALAPEGLAESSVRGIEVTLPEGVALNPAGADGLQACSESEVGFTGTSAGEDEFTDGLAAPFCPDASKVGTLSIHTPLLEHELTGAVYLASQDENPFGSLVAMYLVAEDPVSGSLVKLPGEVSLSATGQITAKFLNSPEVPFEDAKLEFFGGERAPLTTPAHCGSYTTHGVLSPWSGNPPVSVSSTFNVTSGPNGSPCPGASLPFEPSFAAGTSSVQAGGFAQLTTTISRGDGQQPLQGVQIKTPPGLSGLLSSVSLCGEAQADAGTCGPESEIGETTVSVGVGGHPYTVTGGKVFITGPYEGAPFGLSIVNPAKAGPYDLEKGTPCDCVVVRAKIQVDPRTAALTVTTDSTGPYRVPTILDGIPLQIQHINVTINRDGFTFNPTSCDAMSIAATITSTEGAAAPVSVPFQVTNCAILKFAPKFSVSTGAHTSKANGASLTAKIVYPKGSFGTEANVASVKVELPKQLPSRLTTLQKACVAKVFEENPEKCPVASKIGFAKSITPLLPIPVEGPAYFVSHGGEAFPSLIIVLKGKAPYAITVDVVGTTFISKSGITSTTFKTVPDVPFNSFELTLHNGPFSALTANVPNLCNVKSKLIMPTDFKAQNGDELKQSTKISVTGCKAKKAGKKHKKKAKGKKKK